MISVPAEKDINGRDLAPLWATFSEEELRAAERLARMHKMPLALLHNDPVGKGWRYLRDAQMALRGRDAGAVYRSPEDCRADRQASRKRVRR